MLKVKEILMSFHCVSVAHTERYASRRWPGT